MDIYAYKRNNEWKYQVQLASFSSGASPVPPDSDDPRAFISSSETIYIDTRNGKLISATFHSDAFNPTSSSRSDWPVTYEQLHIIVERQAENPNAHFCVKDPSLLLLLNEKNWEEWLLVHIYGEK